MSTETIGTLVILFSLAALLHWLWGRSLDRREAKALLTLEDMAALGEVVPDTLHPVVDENRCITSGACVRACPEKHVIEIVHGRATLVNPLACVGHAACVTACPVGAIKVVFGSATRGVELPRIDPNFQTTRAGLYIIGELGGMGLIRNAIRQGTQAADHVVQSQRRGKNGAVDAIVVGAGPSGIGATLRLMEAGLKVSLLEREALGGTITHFPRAKVTMTGTLEFPMFGKIKRRRMKKEELLELWEEIRMKTGLPVETGQLVEEIKEGSDGMWEVKTPSGVRRGATVLLGLGRRGTPRKLEVPGEELPKVHYRLLEPAEFKDKHVLVVGGGNSAVENAIMLAEFGGCASVALSYRRSTLARCRAENRTKIEAAIQNGSVRALLPSEVVRVGERDVVLKNGAETTTIPNDSVIVQIGGTAPAELLARFGVEVVKKYGEA